MHSRPLFSVLIANYNNGKYLNDAMTSIFSQTYDNWEIIIVDDGSRDLSHIIYQKYENDSRIKVHENNKNYGCGYTKRKCVEYSSGEICGFLDPDDLLTEDAIALMVEKHQQQPDAALISSKYFEINERGEFLSEIKWASSLPKDKSILTYQKGVVTHFSTFKRSFYDKTEGIDVDIKRAVDKDLYLKLEETGKVLFINKALYFYRIYDGGISQKSNKFKADYWSFITKRDAYLRRKKNQLKKINLKKSKFLEIQDEFYFKRAKFELDRDQIQKKMYFILLSLYKSPLTNFKHKIKCLLFLNYA